MAEANPNPAPAPDNSVSQDGPVTPSPSPTPDWFESLPGDLQAEGSLKNFKGKPIVELAKSLVSAQKLVGSSIRVPGKDAKDDEKVKFRETLHGHLGRPSKAEEYKATINAGKDATVDTDFVKVVHGWAYKYGVPDQGVQELFDSYVVNASKHAIDSQKQYEDAVKMAQDEWGAAAPRHLANVKRLLDTTAGPEVSDLLKKSDVANDFRVTRWLAGIAEQLGEDSLVMPISEQQVADYTRELETIVKGGKDHPYYKKEHPEHDKYVKRVYELNQAIHNPANRQTVGA